MITATIVDKVVTTTIRVHLNKGLFVYITVDEDVSSIPNKEYVLDLVRSRITRVVYFRFVS